MAQEKITVRTPVRAVCACGYSTTDPTDLDLWNGYGDHAGAASLVEPEHRVSVWTLSDGTIVVADERPDYADAEV